MWNVLTCTHICIKWKSTKGGNQFLPGKDQKYIPALTSLNVSLYDHVYGDDRNRWISPKPKPCYEKQWRSVVYKHFSFNEIFLLTQVNWRIGKVVRTPRPILQKWWVRVRSPTCRLHLGSWHCTLISFNWFVIRVTCLCFLFYSISRSKG
jgi:hypothetical protein